MPSSTSSSKSSGSSRRAHMSPRGGGSVASGMPSDIASGPPRVVAGHVDSPYPVETGSRPAPHGVPGGLAPQAEGEGQSWGAPPTEPPSRTGPANQARRPPRVPRPAERRSSNPQTAVTAGLTSQAVGEGPLHEAPPIDLQPRESSVGQELRTPRVVGGHTDTPRPIKKRSSNPDRGVYGGLTPVVEGQCPSWGAPPSEPPPRTSSVNQEVLAPRVVAGHTDTPKPTKKRPAHSRSDGPPTRLPTTLEESPPKSSSGKRSREEKGEPSTPKKSQRGESHASEGSQEPHKSLPPAESPARSPPTWFPPRETLTAFSPPPPSEFAQDRRSASPIGSWAPLPEGATPETCRTKREPSLSDIPSPHQSEAHAGGHLIVVDDDPKSPPRGLPPRESLTNFSPPAPSEFFFSPGSRRRHHRQRESIAFGNTPSPGKPQRPRFPYVDPGTPAHVDVSREDLLHDHDEHLEPQSSGSKRKAESDEEELSQSSGSKRARKLVEEKAQPPSTGSKRAREQEEQEEQPSNRSKRLREVEDEMEPPSSVRRYNLRDTPARRRFHASQTERKQGRAKNLSKRSN